MHSLIATGQNLYAYVKCKLTADLTVHNVVLFLFNFSHTTIKNF